MEAITKIRDLKNQFAQEAGSDDWYDYLNHCKSHGFDESEIGYDDLIQFCCKHYVQAAIGSIIDNIELVEDVRSGSFIKSDYKFDKRFDFYINKDSILNAYSLENIK